MKKITDKDVEALKAGKKVTKGFIHMQLDDKGILNMWTDNNITDKYRDFEIDVNKLALQRAGIPIDAYYASEIDNTCIKVSQKHFPDIIRLGDVNNWRTWDIPWKDIDLVMGGFCCQSFSSSGKGKGFMDARGRLFFCFSDIVRHLKKETKGKILFLGENVRMWDEHRRVITEELGVEPVEIDSALVSAQTRHRLYWCN